MVLSRKIAVCFCVTFLLCSFVSFAYWTEPVLLSELNSSDPPSPASTPCISFDSMSIFFARDIIPGRPVIVEAWKDEKDGAFVHSRELLELYHSAYISDPWISKDGLRLYYVEIEYSSVLRKSVRILKMAIRESFSSDWKIYRSYLKLSTPPLGNICSQVSLTEDERTIVWHSRSSEGLAVSKVMSASRPSILHDFSNIQEVVELNELNAVTPFISPDGLAIYFSIKDSENNHDLWMGSRPDMASPFGDFEPIDDINQYGISTASPCISPDGKTLYFFQQQGEPDDLEHTGVFVSYWVEDPFDAAVNNLDEAIALKTEAAEMIDTAMEKETQALEILAALPPEQTPAHLTAKQLHEIQVCVEQALQRQIVARDSLRRGLVYLNQAFMGLLPPVIVDIHEPDSAPTE